MHSWNSLTITEQTLLRLALSGSRLAGTVQHHGAALRWAGAEDAPPPRSYTEAEQRALVPRLAAVALGLADRGLLAVHEERDADRGTAGTVLTGSELSKVLADPANWLRSSRSVRRFSLAAADSVRERWSGQAYPVAHTLGLPGWDELSIAQCEVLVCAAESGGMLTGAFGIWSDPPTCLDAVGRLEWVDRQLGPLVPFVRDGWIEVRHFADEHGDAFTVIPLEGLRSAFNDPAVRYEGDDWGIGLGCVFTYAGLAVWQGGWSKGWGRHLTFD